MSNDKSNMKDVLSKDTVKLIEKYDSIIQEAQKSKLESIPVSIDDMEFLLGYTEGSVLIESRLKDNIYEAINILSEVLVEQHTNGDITVKNKINEAINKLKS